MDIPHFIPNEPDDLHCNQSCVRMVWQATKKCPLSLEDAEKETGFIAGKLTWPYKTYLFFARNGFEVKIMDIMDSQAFAKNPEKTVISLYGEDIWKFIKAESDVEGAKQDAQSCLEEEKISTQTQVPTQNDIVSLLLRGYYLIANVNPFAMRGEEGYVGHSVIISDWDAEKQEIILQDPGLPGVANKRVAWENFRRAWEYPNREAANLMAVRLIT